MTRCPSLDELPPPPAGKTGWPWTEESPPLPDVMSDGVPWPRLTILTTSYNHGRFIEETLRSVLLQGYPDLEYIVTDGASNDGSVDIIRKYEAWLARWTSMPDRGPEHALNRVTAHITGDLVGLVPTSDLSLPSAFRHFADAYTRWPGSLLLGAVEVFEDGGGVLWVTRPSGVMLENVLVPFSRPWNWHGLGLMVPAPVYRAAGPFDETLPYCSDEDWLCRLLQHAQAAYVQEPVARSRMHAGAATPRSQLTAVRARLRIVERYWHVLPRLDLRWMRAQNTAYEASVYLGHNPTWAQYWDRGAGLRLLLHAAHQDPRILGERHFLRLLRRALTPRRWLRSSPWR